MSTSTVTVPKPTADTCFRDDPRTLCVVIPMPNDPPWELFESIPDNIPIIVCDDSNGRLTRPSRPNVFLLDYAAQEAYAGRHYAAMPHRSAASRNIGHYVAYQEGFDVILALDYDCRTGPDWLQGHLRAIGPRTNAAGLRPEHAGGWVNTINNTFPNGDRVYARGFPYEWRSPDLSATHEESVSGRTALHMGVWDGVLDLNGIDKLYGGEPADPGITDADHLVALGNLPICGMNTSFIRELTPAYFFLPDIWVRGWQLSRHDDIWGGYIVKRLMDQRGDLVSFGGPIVGHTKQTPLDRVVVLEHWMHLMSMPFYDLVDEAIGSLQPADYATMFAHFVEEYVRALETRHLPSHFREVFRELGDWMLRWSEAYR